MRSLPMMLTTLLVLAGCGHGKKTHEARAAATAGTTSSATGAPAAGSGYGKGVFVDGTAPRFAFGTRWHLAVGAGDFDRDGSTDVVLIEAEVNGDAWLVTCLQKVPAQMQLFRYPLDGSLYYAQKLDVVDMNGDSILDLVIGHRWGFVRVYLGDGAGSFHMTEFEAPGARPPLGVCWTTCVGDLDGDLAPDVYVGSKGQAAAQSDLVFLNDGRGGLRAVPGLVPANGGSPAVALLDADGDGDLDAFAAQGLGGYPTAAGIPAGHVLYMNDGTGRFTDRSATYLPAGFRNLPPTPGGPSTGREAVDVVAADFDRDGRTDLFLGSRGVATGNGTLWSPAPSVLLLRSGSGFVDASSRLPRDDAATRAVRRADVNGDGWPDLVLATMRGPHRLYVNRNGVLVDASSDLPPVATQGSPAPTQLWDNVKDLCVADVDGDRAEDVMVVGAPSGQWSKLLLNRP